MVNGNITTVGDKNIGIQSSGDVLFSGGKLLLAYKSHTYDGIGIINNSGTVTVTAGEIVSGEDQDECIQNNAGTVNIEGGLVRSINNYGVNNNGGEVKVDSGTITASTAIKNADNGNVTINEVIINASKAIQNLTKGNVEIKGGTFTLTSNAIENNDATMTITNVELTSSGSGITNSNNAIINIQGGNFTTTKDGFTNSSEQEMSISGGTITSSSGYALNSSAGTINIENNVKLNSTESSAIYTTSNITIGEKDEVVKDEPVITGKIYGIINYSSKGQIRIYDGTINAETHSIRGAIEEIEDNKVLDVEKPDGTVEVAKISDIENIAYIGDDPSDTYTDLQSAIDACGESNKITLLKNVHLLCRDTKIISNNQNITINLNGKDIVSNIYEKAIENNGQLTITDETEGSPGGIWGYGKTILSNESEGILIMQSGNMYSDETCDSGQFTSCINNQGEIQVLGGTIRSTRNRSYSIETLGNVLISDGEIKTEGSSSYAINQTNGSLTIEGGKIETKGEDAIAINYSSPEKIQITDGHINSGAMGIKNTSVSDITIQKSEFITKKESIYKDKGGKLEFLDSNINSESYGIYIKAECETLIEELTITSSSYSVYLNWSTSNTTIKNSDLSSKNDVIFNYGTLTIIGGTITSTNSWGIDNERNLSITGTTLNTGSSGIRNGAYSYKGTTDIYEGTKIYSKDGNGVYNYNGDLKVYGEGTTINSKNRSGIGNEKGNVYVYEGVTVTSETASGIQNTNQNCSITLGEDGEDAPNIESPVITGGTYGINCGVGTFNFYDGILTGNSRAIYGEVTATPEMYQEKYKNVEETVAILGIRADFENLIRVGTTYYDTLQTAVNVVSNTSSRTDTIYICNDIQMSSQVIIPENTNITIALEGHQLNYNVDEPLIVNNGNLTIVDYVNVEDGEAQEVSMVRNQGGIAIQNNETLILGQEDNLNKESPQIVGSPAISGNPATVKSGITQDIENTLGYSVRKTQGLKKFLLNNKLALSTKTKMYANPSYPEWTKDSVNVRVNSDTIPVLNLYYSPTKIEPKTLSYTIEYYKDDELVRDDTETIEQIVEDPEENMISVDRSKIDLPDKYPGYRLDSTDPADLPEKVENGAVIKVKYTKRTDLSYKVYYLDKDDESEVASTKTVDNQTYQAEVTEEAVDVDGYTKEEPTSKSITIDVENNEIKFYYSKRKDLSYTVYYLEKGEGDEDIEIANKKEVSNKTYKETVTENAIDIEGYVKPEPETQSIEIGTETNEIKFYYTKRNDLKYKVEFYYSGTKKEEKTEEFDNQTFNTVINRENIAEIIEENKTEGYRIATDEEIKAIDGMNEAVVDDGVVGTPLTIGVDEESNIIKVFYAPDENQKKTLKYTVEYYKDGEKVDGDTEEVTKEVQVLEEDTTIEVDKSAINTEDKYPGYVFEKTVPTEIPDVVNDGDVIYVYYILDNSTETRYNYTIEYYFENEKADELTETFSATEGTIIEDYPERVKEGYKLDKVEPEQLVVSKVESENVMRVYYVIDEDQTKELSYQVEYYKDDELVEKETITETVQVLEPDNLLVDKENINTTDKYKGYEFDEEKTGVIPDEVETGTVIKIYYTKAKYTYKVEYYYNGEKDEGATEELEAEYGDLIIVYPNKNKEGYKLEKTENLPLVISEDEESNIIRVYYVEENPDGPKDPEDPDNPKNPDESQKDDETSKEEDKDKDSDKDSENSQENNKKPDDQKVENKIETKPTTKTEKKLEKQQVKINPPKTEDTIIKTVIMLITSSMIAVITTIKRMFDK